MVVVVVRRVVDVMERSVEAVENAVGEDVELCHLEILFNRPPSIPSFTFPSSRNVNLTVKLDWLACLWILDGWELTSVASRDIF